MLSALTDTLFVVESRTDRSRVNDVTNPAPKRTDSMRETVPRDNAMTLTLVTKPPAQSIAGQVHRPILIQWAAIPLRLVVGYGFIAHGYAKLSRGPETFAVILHTIGVPFPHLMAWLTTLVELIGGFAVLIGAFVPIVSLPMMAVLLTAMFTIHLPYGFFSVKLVEVTEHGTKFGPVGYEVILLYLASLVALAFGGAGPLSVDRWLSARTFLRNPSS
jgi:putative oxidoreductase